MKLNPQYVNGHNAPTYLCKVQRDSWVQRLVWWAFRRYLLNEDYYRVSRRFTGPRPKGTSQVSTRKENATAFRYYIEARPRKYPALYAVQPTGRHVIREYPSGARIVSD